MRRRTKLLVLALDLSELLCARLYVAQPSAQRDQLGVLQRAPLLEGAHLRRRGLGLCGRRERVLKRPHEHQKRGVLLEIALLGLEELVTLGRIPRGFVALLRRLVKLHGHLLKRALQLDVLRVERRVLLHPAGELRGESFALLGRPSHLAEDVRVSPRSAGFRCGRGGAAGSA